MQAYWKEINILLEKVAEQENENIENASKLIAERIKNGGILQLFGCGHSHLLAQEAYYRAGGLVPVAPINIEPLMLHKGALTSSSNEKDPTLIGQYKDQVSFEPNDILIVISTSGRNPAPIDMAFLGKEAGILVISLQSLSYRNQEGRHASGKRLEEVVDIVLNTYVPVGDGLLSNKGLQYGPASTVVGAALLNALICQVIEEISKESEELPVFKSANLSDSQFHNETMLKKYRNRIDFT
ncbi:SIS domain-containing protein [Psychrobacillus psychrodurans]|uniref:SIS domain-containing protein n=1 Tax=Psychrobacillus psychrodurans TaxID=126157 RepID=A0A9X3LAC3_9BACI|nr:SIS domain-containing protein [Psychrobacillus psychrodurans]MCZ8534296.1 SIS domain-containing protein [Psychrobacillus psychrodurans]